jgi:phosphate transport system substrate-binding protein
MKLSRLLAVLSAGVLLLIGGALTLNLGCGKAPTGTGGAVVSKNVKLGAGGSTFVNPMMGKWAKTYNETKGVKVDYSATGSGNGIQQMVEKTIDFGCTDAPLNEEQIAKAKDKGGAVVHLPLVMGGLVPAYNLESVKEPLKFTGPVLADIYLGKIKRWNDPALKALNPGVDLPDQDIAVVYRSDGSGSTYIWTDYLSKVSPECASTIKKGTSVNWPAGIGQKGTEGVAGHVGRTPGAIGYIELLYALNQKIKYGSVQNKEGEFVLASLESVTEAAKNAQSEIPDDLRYSLTNVGGKTSYPISGTVWGVLYEDQTGNPKGKDLVDFLKWVVHDGQDLTKDLHYARLPPELVERVDRKLADVKTK